MQSQSLTFASAHPHRAIGSHAIPILIGQLAVMANGLVDSIMAGRAGSDILAAMAVGSSVYISLYVGLMGVIIGLTPICSAHFGAGRHKALAEDAAQGIWVALALSALGWVILLNPGFLFALTDTPDDIAQATEGYLQGIAVGLPAALMFRVFYALNQSISKPKVVMALQVLMLTLKVPLNFWLMHGGWGMPALGAAGFGWATAVTMWLVLAVSWILWRRQSLYHPYRLGRWVAPNWTRLKVILRLGLPIGGAYFIEVTSFTFIALLVSRFGVHEVGGHQIVANMAATAYMICLALANATTVMTAQQLGAGQVAQAKRMVWAGLRIAIGMAVLVCALFYWFDLALITAYTADPATIAVAMSLMPWVIAYHFVDAIQTIFSFALRAYGVSTRPMLIYMASLWGVGIGGGMWLGVWQTPALQALGFWIAAAGGLLIAAVGLGFLLTITIHRHQRLVGNTTEQAVPAAQ